MQCARLRECGAEGGSLADITGRHTSTPHASQNAKGHDGDGELSNQFLGFLSHNVYGNSHSVG